MQHKFSIICITEIWTNNDNELLLTIPGYKRYLKNRETGRGGGVALFVLNDLSCSLRHDLDIYASVNFEFIFIELHHPSIGRKIVGAVYRPPDSNLDLFMNGFDCVMSKLTLSKAERIITSDYNIDLLKNESHIRTVQFINSLYSHSLIPTIIKPTRFGRDTSTLIDNIFTQQTEQCIYIWSTNHRYLRQSTYFLYYKE